MWSSNYNNRKLLMGKKFCKGERVYVRNFGQGSRWLSAVIEEVTGPVSYVVS